jgi:diguanylate cyclase (GGDEF)-like protein/PAS domain S-box-containing protein
LVSRNSRCHVLYAENGLQALDRFREQSVTAVLTDLQMDGMDGLALVRSIRAKNPRIPVVLMTAHGSEDVAMEALRVGATDYVPKHRLGQELREILARTLRTAMVGKRRQRCIESLVQRESRFELGNDPSFLPPLLEFLQDEMSQLDRWDSAEQMRTTIALDEALRNALFHGNLEIGSELRQHDDSRFHELAHQRAVLPLFRDRRITVLISHDADCSRFVVRDEGPGFDTSRAARPIEPEDLLRSSGRGLLLMKSFMDSVVFNETGNEVTLIKRRTAPSQIDPLVTSSSSRDDGMSHAVPCSARAAAVEAHSEKDENEATEPPLDEPMMSGPPRGLSTSSGSLEPELYKRLLDSIGDAVCFVDTGRRILYWNSAAEQLTGYSSDDVIGRHCFDDRPDQLDRTGCQLCHRECPLAQAIEQDQSLSERLFLRHRSGRRISVEARVTPVRNDNGAIIGCVEVFQDATSSVVVENAYRQVREAADRDPLTGLANRRFLNRLLEDCLKEWERSGQRFSVIMADLDHFKHINDTFGHVVGDQVLVKFAGCLQSECRPGDLVARFGGEEFVVLLPHEELATAANVAERLRQSIVMAALDELGQRRLTASFGVAQADSGDTVHGLLQRADSALYKAKSLGRDKVELEPPASCR